MMVLIILLALGAVAGLVLRNKQHPAGTTILVACSLLTVLAASARLFTNLGGPSPHERLNDELAMVRYIMASEFGRYLAEQPSGTQALCILSPNDDGNEILQQGLKDGLGEQIPVEFAVLARDASDDLDVVGMTAAKVNAMLDQYPGTDLVVTMADLPYQGVELAALLRKRKVRLAATRVLVPAILAPYDRARVLAGAVAYQENPASISEVKKGTPEEIFASQFVLIPGRS